MPLGAPREASLSHAFFLLLLPIRLSAGDERGLQEFRSGGFGEILQSVKGRPAVVHFSARHTACRR